MANFFTHIASTVSFLICWLLVFIWIVALHRQWWHLRGVRRALWIVPLAVLALIGLWTLATANHLLTIGGALGFIASILVTGTMALVISLPASGFVLSGERLATWLWFRKDEGGRMKDEGKIKSDSSFRLHPSSFPDPSRRSFVTTAAAAIPAAAVGTAAFGVANSYSAVTFPEVPMRFANLPAALDGLRILQLSDIHLGYYVSLDDLDETIRAAAKMRPDLVLVTGDVADDLKVLPDALRMIDALKPRLGTFASLGNHEYYRGIGTVRRDFDAGPIPLLVNQGMSVKVGDTELFISAADDPARTRSRDNIGFLRSSIDAALNGAPSNAFHLLMSHRPEGFDVAADEGIHLTLSGHYHGGIQMGWNGRAIIQPFAPNKHFWGYYRKGDSQLYTTSGVGHWFPFRLNCPREAPVYVLRQA
jgi:hypothetical protein